MKGLLRATWLLLLCLGQVHAATTQDEDAQAAKALLERALAYYQSNGDKAFAAFSRQGDFVDQDRYVFVVDTKGVLLASGVLTAHGSLAIDSLDSDHRRLTSLYGRQGGGDFRDFPRTRPWQS